MATFWSQPQTLECVTCSCNAPFEYANSTANLTGSYRASFEFLVIWNRPSRHAMTERAVKPSLQKMQNLTFNTDWDSPFSSDLLIKAPTLQAGS